RSAADHDHRRLLGIGLGDGVGDLQPADAIGDADRAEPLEPRIGVGGEPGALFVRGVDDADGPLLHLRKEAEDIVARDAEGMADAFLRQPADEILTNRFRHSLLSGTRERTGRHAGEDPDAYRGSTVSPMRCSSIARAHWRPSRIAQTTSDWPRRI